MNLLWGLAFLALAPAIGGLVSGADRIITARMQGRVGPPLLQPFYDVMKLYEKERIVVTKAQSFFVSAYLLFMALTGAIFFSGGDFILVIFSMTLAHTFLVLAGYSAHSPYSFIGAQREIIQVMAFEPMILLVAAGMYMVTRSFYVSDIAASTRPMITLLPGLFIGLLCVLTIKLRKSPYDLSTSHHAHQEIVKGITTEFSGSTLASVEIAHWYETVLVLGFVYLFFAFSPPLAMAAMAATYSLELLVDNSYPRFKLALAVQSSWALTLVLGMGNILVLWYYLGGGA